MWYIHTTEYYSGLKRKEIYAITKMNLEDIMLSEISQSQKRYTQHDFTYMSNS